MLCKEHKCQLRMPAINILLCVVLLTYVQVIDYQFFQFEYCLLNSLLFSKGWFYGFKLQGVCTKNGTLPFEFFIILGFKPIKEIIIIPVLNIALGNMKNS